MSKAAPKREKTPKIPLLMLAQARALEAGKAGYRKADAITDVLVAEIAAGRLKAGEAVKLPDGTVGRVIDKFDGKTKVGYGGACRRYDVEISRAEDVAAQL